MSHLVFLRYTNLKILLLLLLVQNYYYMSKEEEKNTRERERERQKETMYPSNEQIKAVILNQIPPDGRAHSLLARYWNQFMVYLLLAPLQWIHLIHMVYFTCWNKYHFTTKSVMMVYILLCLTIWECVRIVAFHAFHLNTAELKEITVKVATTAYELGMEGLAKFKPQYDRVHDQMADLASKVRKSTIDNLTKMKLPTTTSDTDGGGGGDSRAQSPSGGSN